MNKAAQTGKSRWARTPVGIRNAIIVGVATIIAGILTAMVPSIWQAPFRSSDSESTKPNAVSGSPNNLPNPPNSFTDAAGHPLESPANSAELALFKVQDQIMDLRQYMVSAQLPDSRRNLKDAPYLAQRILDFRDADLSPRRRYIKYEYAAFAYVDAATAAIFEDRLKVKTYGSLALKNADNALDMLTTAEAGDPSDSATSSFLDWVQKDNGKDRVLYLRADAFCMMGIATKDSKLKQKASETWNLISEGYRAGLPASGSPQLSGCVSK